MNKNKIFIEVGSIVTYIYGAFNLLSVVFMFVFPWDEITWLTELVLSVDVFTWHIFGAFSIFTFIGKIKCVIKEKQKGIQREYTTITTILHLIFMIVSFVCICYLFSVCF